MMTLDKVIENCKEGWMLNPNEKIVKAIINGINRCDGECPCANDGEDSKCPCSNYRLKDYCCCKLYVKENE